MGVACDGPLEGRWAGRRNCARGRVGTSEYAGNVSIATPLGGFGGERATSQLHHGSSAHHLGCGCAGCVDPRQSSGGSSLARPHRSHVGQLPRCWDRRGLPLAEIADHKRKQEASTAEIITSTPPRCLPARCGEACSTARRPHRRPDLCRLFHRRYRRSPSCLFLGLSKDKVRRALGRSGLRAVRRRGDEERIGDGMAAECDWV